jgi:hypothetical protein
MWQKLVVFISNQNFTVHNTTHMVKAKPVSTSHAVSVDTVHSLLRTNCEVATAGARGVELGKVKRIVR